jgi:hypothetical protein
MTAEDLAEHSRAVADEREAAAAIEAWHTDQQRNAGDASAGTVAVQPGRRVVQNEVVRPGRGRGQQRVRPLRAHPGQHTLSGYSS